MTIIIIMLVQKLKKKKKIGDWMGDVHVGSDVISFGDVLKAWVGLDAFIVLSGSVLTAYVGIGGLLK